jgi:hypothetical protein
LNRPRRRPNGNFLRRSWSARITLAHLGEPFPQPLLGLEIALAAPVVRLAGPIRDGTPEFSAAARGEEDSDESTHGPAKYESSQALFVDHYSYLLNLSRLILPSSRPGYPNYGRTPPSTRSDVPRLRARAAIPETRLDTISTAASEVCSIARFSTAWTPRRPALS